VKAERIMQVFDWLYSDKGIELYSYGVAGETFDYVAGKPILRPELLVESFVSYRSVGLQYGLFTVNKGHYYELPETLATEAYLRYNAELIANGVCVLRDRTIAGQITVDEFTRQYQALKARGFQAIIDEGAAAYAAKSR
jgi:hypothetical protein